MPDHSSLTKIRERYGLSVFQCFFERIVEVCIEAELVWGKELYLDATKVEANASADSMKPRFAVEAHLSELFCSDEESPIQNASQVEVDHEVEERLLLELPAEEGREDLLRANTEDRDWISRIGRPQREIACGHYKRKADFLVSSTDPDASLMQRRAKASHPGYHTHYVVDGSKARVILGVLVTPSEVMENQPMLDLVFRSRFRWHIRPRRVTGDTTYGTIENIKSLEDAGIGAYCPLPEWGKRTPFFGKNEFTYNPERDVYVCPQGEDLRRHTLVRSDRVVKYRGTAAVCNSCILKSQCTNSLNGRGASRAFEEDYLDKVLAYHKTELYQKSMRKRRVWVEPLFGEGKQFHGMSRFRLRSLEKVNDEALLIAASGQNIKRLLIFWSQEAQSTGAGSGPAPTVGCHQP
ncbi:MAG: transposase [Rubrobacteraceae bacterium]